MAGSNKICIMCGQSPTSATSQKYCDQCIKAMYQAFTGAPPPPKVIATCHDCGKDMVDISDVHQFVPYQHTVTRIGATSFTVCKACYDKRTGANPRSTCSDCGRPLLAGGVRIQTGRVICHACYLRYRAANTPQNQGAQAPTGGTKVRTIRIYWDVSIQAYRIVTPFNQAFVDALKALIPSGSRNWDQVAKMWTVTEQYMPVVKQLAEKYFSTQAQVLSKDQVEAAQRQASANASVGSSAPALSESDQAILAFFKLLPYTAAKKAFQLAAMELHPDKNQGNGSKMSELNANWQEIERSLFGKGA